MANSLEWHPGGLRCLHAQVARQVFIFFFFLLLDSSPNERNILSAGFVSLGILWSYYLLVLPSSASADLKRAKWALIVTVLNGTLKIQHNHLCEESEAQNIFFNSVSFSTR